MLRLLLTLSGVVALMSVFRGDSKQPRGIRNNNPGNIKITGIRWKGAIGDDGVFLVFDKPENGLRALARIIKNYRVLYGVDTVAGIINRYAPAIENDSGAYINHVARVLGVDPAERINTEDPQTLGALVRVIVLHENGTQPYTDEQINQGIQEGLA